MTCLITLFLLIVNGYFTDQGVKTSGAKTLNEILSNPLFTLVFLYNSGRIVENIILPRLSSGCRLTARLFNFCADVCGKPNEEQTPLTAANITSAA